MRAPVVFQDLEDELKPTLKYVRGRVLNAGCGSRDITEFLTKAGASSVEHCDLKTTIPNAIIADLGSIPIEDSRYDTIICNAVLEHAQFPDKVMQELRRVLKPDGHLIVCIPFIQPYHPAPDFRRYSREGMLELARIHEFDTLEIFPVHTLAQTVTWVWWTYLGEKKKHFQMALLWLPFYLWCQTSKKTDFSVDQQANSYQMILKKSPAKHNGNGR
jgi:ubiquinone/menaquinone biosynthesis C-methylase UbiE